MANKPVKVFKGRSKGVEIAIFENPKGMICTLSKSFQVNGEWRNQKVSYFPNQIDDLIATLIEARDFCEGAVSPAQEEDGSRASADVPDVIDHY